MSLLRNIASGLRSLVRKERIKGELDEELRGFLEMAAQEKIKQGMSRKEALRAVSNIGRCRTPAPTRKFKRTSRFTRIQISGCL